MKQKTPKVSVIMPVYYREQYVKDAVTSILHQSFLDFEVIIIEDGSSDSTFEILQTLEDKRIKDE